MKYIVAKFTQTSWETSEDVSIPMIFLAMHCDANTNNANYNLRYADDTTLMAESEEELKSLLIKV